MTNEQKSNSLCFQFSQEEIEALKIDIKDNFADLTDADRMQILDYITTRFYYPSK